MGRVLLLLASCASAWIAPRALPRAPRAAARASPRADAGGSGRRRALRGTDARRPGPWGGTSSSVQLWEPLAGLWSRASLRGGGSGGGGGGGGGGSDLRAMLKRRPG